MLFLNPWLLAGLVGATIPIIIHLVRQQAAKPIEWGLRYDCVVSHQRLPFVKPDNRLDTFAYPVKTNGGR